jgi:putative inorganic carbon (HCO3(-)) transporter
MSKVEARREVAKPPADKGPGHETSARIPAHARWLGTRMFWWAGLVLVLPCIFLRAVIHVTDVPRLVVLSVFCFGFVLSFSVFKQQRWSSAPVRRGNKLLAWLAAGFLVVLLVSSCDAVNKQEALDCIVRFLLVVVVTVLFAGTVVREEALLERLFKVLAAVLLVQAVVGILQFYGLAFTNLPPPKDDVPYGLMGHRTVFSSGLALLFPFCGYVAFAGELRWKVLAGSALWLGIYGTILGHTRSAWLAVAGSLLLANALVVLLRQRLGTALVRSWFQAMAWLVTGTIVAAVLAVAIPNREGFNRELKNRMRSLLQLSEKNNEVGTGRFRFVLWHRSLEMLRDHPLLGVGPGNWRVVVPQYGAEGLNVSFLDGSVVRDHAHNVYLETGAETGLPGLVLYLAMTGAAAGLALAVVFGARDNSRRMLGIVSLAVICIYSVDSFFSFPNEIITHMLFLALGLGSAVGLYQNMAPPNAEASGAFRWQRAFLVLPMSFLLFSAWFGYSKGQFEYRDVRARALLPLHRPEQILEEVNAGVTPFVTISHYGDPLEYYSACAYLELGRPEQALEALQRARRLNPGDIFTLSKMGEVYGNLHRLDDAIGCYRECLRLAPLFEDGFKGLAIGYYNKGMYRECCETLNRFHLQHDIQCVCHLGYAYFNLQEYDKSATALRDGLGRFPHNAELLEFLACLEYSKLNDLTNAFEHFQRLLALSPNHPKRDEYNQVINYLAPRVGKAARNPAQPGRP